MDKKENKKAGPEPRRRVFVGMSGGVDSSVAAYLLKNQGYDVVGVFIRSYNIDGCAERDAEDARRVAEKLHIPFYVFDFEEEYKKRVVDYMVSGYRAGITPNPDVMCNKEIKFGLFLEKALAMGADYVATGHYVRRLPFSQHRLSARSSDELQSALSPRRVRPRSDTKPVGAPRAAAQKEPPSFGLGEAKDKTKDQSYFLWTLTQKQLKHCLFPVGDYLKSEVREIARQAGLPTADKKDSQGICFLGKVTLEEFLGNYIPSKSGEVLTTDGKSIGEHRGAEFYTIGQRHLGIKNYELGIKGRHETPAHYVAAKDIKTNIVVLAEGDDNPALYKNEVELENINFINIEPGGLIRTPARRSKSEGGNVGIRVLARVRYRQPLAPAKLITSQLESKTKNYKLEFDQPVKFVAAGQSAVFYSGDSEMLGGGIIK